MNFLSLVLHYETHGIECEWHFFASCHGKSACDGLGGTVKKLARYACLKDPNVDISSAETLFKWCKKEIKGVTFAFCTMAEHTAIETALSSMLDQAQFIEGTLGFAAFIPVNKDNKKQIIVKRTTWSTNSQIKDVVNNVKKVTK